MNLKRLFLMMLPGLAPLLVYVVASELWGDLIGLLVALGLGMVEFVMILFIQRRVEAFVAVDLGILALSGAVSLWSGDELFFRLKPVLMEVILIVFVALSTWGPKNLLVRLAFRGQDGEQFVAALEQNQAANGRMKRNLAVITLLLGAHALLSLAAALWMSKEVWAFITGILLYLLLGLWVLIQVVLRWTLRR